MNQWLRSPTALTGTGTLVLYDGSAIASVVLNSSTANAALTKVDNKPVAPASYTFVTTLDLYEKIFSGQCDRVSNYIFGQLERLDRGSDEDQNEVIIERIADVIDLVGEPAACTTVLEARLLKQDPPMLEPLLLAIGSAQHKETEAGRVQILSQFASDSDYRVKRAAVRALGRMNTEAARRALVEISRHHERTEIGRFAAAMLR